jgi:uncharacterized protein YceH (UPF0502 family)
MSELVLCPAQARVLACLVEKSILTPQYYPMTAHALMLAANQKTMRHPQMNLSEGEVGAALMRLETLKLAARDDFSGRVPKWRHQFQHQLLLKPPALAVLVALMLRGPQTLAELRANAAALGGPASLEDLQAQLADLADRAQPLVRSLPRAAGQSAVRFAHTLCGESAPAAPAPAARPAPESPSVSELAELRERLAALEARVAELEARLVSVRPAS